MTSKYIAIGIYLIVLAMITFVSSRRGNGQDFLIASRSIGWPRLGLAIFASLLSSYNLVLGITFSYLFGPWFVVVYFGVLAAFVAIYYLFKRDTRETSVARGYITIVDYFADRFGIINANILNLSLMLVLFIFIGLQFFINTAVFSNIFGWDKYTSAFLVGGVVLLYTLIGGLKVSILTDVFQGILMLVIGGMAFLADTSKITYATIQPMLTNTDTIIGAFSLAASQFLTLLAYPELWQRVYASRSLRDLRKGFTFAWLLLLVIIVPEIIIGLSAKASGPIVDPSNIFYDVLKLASPTWYIPILSVALLAAFMSTLDSALFAIGVQLGKYGFWFNSTKLEGQVEASVVRKTRYAVAMVTVLALALSLFFANFLAVVFNLISLLTVISVAILCALFFKLANKQITLVILVGMVCFVTMTWTGLITSEPLTTLYPSFALVTYAFLQSALLRLNKRFGRDSNSRNSG